jgi:hypothetical protein
MSPVLRAITGWAPRKYSTEFEDPLAFNKFVVFALASSVLVPDAARKFRRAFQTERNEIANEHRRLRMRKTQREKQEPANLNWFVKNSAEMFPGEPVVLPLRESCVQVVNGKRMLVCAIPDCTATIDPEEFALTARQEFAVQNREALDAALSRALADEYTPPKMSMPVTTLADEAMYVCHEHNPKPAQGVFFQAFAWDDALGKLGSKGAGRTSSGDVKGNGRGRELRRLFDGNEPFMTQGHQTLKPGREYNRPWKTPDWMHEDDKVAAFLSLRFPRIATDEQRERAARWGAVIQFYFRQGLPAGERIRATRSNRENRVGEHTRASEDAVTVDGVMKWKAGTAEGIVQKIRRMLQGRWANGRKPTGGKRGRPQKRIDMAQVVPELQAA